MTTSAHPFGAARQHVRWYGAVIVLLAFLAYGSVLGGDYVFDDVHSVAANRALVEPGGLWRLLADPSAFSATGQRMYRPVLLLSFAGNLAISPAAWSLKAGNLLLHATAAWLLFGWLRRLSVRRQGAFVMAALFAVHPLASEAVNLVSARSELLLACGMLLGLRCHLAWHRGRTGALAFAGMIAGCVVACGSKETGVVLPAVMLLQAWWVRTPLHAGGNRGRNWRRAVAGVLPVVLVVVGYLLLRKLLLGQAAVDVLARTAGDPTTGHGRTLLVHLATMGTLLPKALLQMVVPVGLTLDPLVTFRQSLLDPWVLVGWAAVLGATVAAAWPGPTAHLRRLGLCCAWGLALPWVVIPLNMPLAEHRLYGPMLGVALVLAPLLPRLRFALPVRRAGLASIGVAVALVVGIGLSARRSLQYRSEAVLWQAELAQRPTSFQAWWGLGATHLRMGDPAAAVEPLANALDLRPMHEDALRYLTEALTSLPDAHTQPFRALAAATRLAARVPDDPWVRTLLARAHLQVGTATGDHAHFDAAERQALSCLTIAAPKGYVYLLAAKARAGRGDLEGALAHLDTSLARGLDHTAVRLERHAVLRAMGRAGEARRELHRLQQQAPMDPAVLQAMRELAQPPR